MTTFNATTKPNNNNHHKRNLPGNYHPPKNPNTSHFTKFRSFFYRRNSLCNLFCFFCAFFFLLSEICEQMMVRYHSRWRFTTPMICKISLSIHPTFLHVCKFFIFGFPFVQFVSFLCLFFLATSVKCP